MGNDCSNICETPYSLRERDQLRDDEYRSERLSLHFKTRQKDKEHYLDDVCAIEQNKLAMDLVKTSGGDHWAIELPSGVKYRGQVKGTMREGFGTQ